MSDKIYLGSRAAQVETDIALAPVTRVIINVDGQNAYAAGDESGRTVEVRCSWADQSMANRVLERVRGIEYSPYSAVDALLDPAAEIGDGITVGGVYSGLYSTDELFDSLYSADIAAPGGDEIDDEYPYLSPKDRQDKRESTKIYSVISKTAEEILLKVADDMAGQEASITIRIDSIISRVEDAEKGIGELSIRADEITARVKDTEGNIGDLEITAKEIAARVRDAEGNIGDLEVTAKEIAARVRDAEGNIGDLEVTANEISARVESNGEDISSLTLVAKGLLSTVQEVGSSISQVQQKADEISSSVTDLQDGLSHTLKLDARGVYIVDQSGNAVTISGGQIDATTIRVSNLYGQYVYLRTSGNTIAGRITITGASSADYAVDLTSYGALRMTAAGGDVYISGAGNVGLHSASGYVVSHSSLRPGYGCSLGNASYKWTEVYASTGTINTSDREEKNSIDGDLTAYEAMFAALRPVRFKYNDGNHGRIHTGFIAQEVEEAMTAAGLTDMDFAGLIKSASPEEDRTIYGLRYGEFVSLNTYMIQKLTARVEELERRIA